MINLKLISLWSVVGILLISPTVVGVFPVLPAIMIQAVMFVFSCFAFTAGNSRRRSKRIALVGLAVSLAITLADSFSRPLLSAGFEQRPREIATHQVPKLPQLYRFSPNINFRGTTFGDLAALSGNKEWRMAREIVFQTNAHGFRNDAREDDRPLDLIVLGDSYGVGDGTSQEKIWPSLLASEHDLAVYNLSMDGASPWQEYVNLLIEADHLKTRQGTTVLWLLFTGNDLIDPCYPAFTREELPWLSTSGRLVQRVKTYRYNSPLRSVLLLRGQHSERDDLLVRVSPDGQIVLFNQAYAQLAALSLEQVKRHPNYENVKTTFAAMKRLTDERQLRLVVAVAPSKEEVYDWVIARSSPWSSGPTEPSGFVVAIEHLSQENGVTFHDLKPSLIEAARRTYVLSGEWLWWRDDTHWNEAGHSAVASILYDRLLQPRGAGNHNPQTNK